MFEPTLQPILDQNLSVLHWELIRYPQSRESTTLAGFLFEIRQKFIAYIEDRKEITFEISVLWPSVSVNNVWSNSNFTHIS